MYIEEKAPLVKKLILNSAFHKCHKISNGLIRYAINSVLTTKNNKLNALS